MKRALWRAAMRLAQREGGVVTARILVVDDEPAMRLGLQQVLKREGYEVELAEDGERALDRLRAGERFDAVVTDLRMPRCDGMEVLSYARGLDPCPLVFMITAFGDVPTAVQAMQRGATDFIMKPFKIEDVRTRVRTALLKRELSVEDADSSDAGAQPEASEGDRSAACEAPDADAVFADFPEIIGRSEGLAGVLRTIKKIAATRCTVLVLGETGTGKELIARAIHRLSPRCESPFVATANALSESLVEAELFGHVKGSFTGAESDRAGYFEAADTGTLFLDEVGDLPPAVQVKLLRVIQEGEINRVGDPRSRTVDVRLVAATWRDLKDSSDGPRFREDLYYRLSVITVVLPPLRERGDDIVLLAKRFLAEQGGALGRELVLSEAALARLRAHDWPGNIRELKNRVTRLAIYAEGDLVDAAAVELAFEDEA